MRIQNQEGSIMAIVILIVSSSFAIGMFALNQSITETFIAANDADGKRAFYCAESGLEIAKEILEQNIACPAGAMRDGVQTYDDDIEIFDPLFWQTNKGVEFSRYQIKDNAAARLIGCDNYLAYSYHKQFMHGGAAPVGEGYESGGSTAAKSIFLIYTIYSECLGLPNADAVLAVEYRHILGTEEECHF